MRQFSGVLGLSLMLGACHSPEAPGAELPHGSAVLVDDVNSMSLPVDPITVDSATFHKVLGFRVYVSFGGGCKEHLIALAVERGFAKSLPPIARARVAHDARGDACDALLSQVITVDMSAVREHTDQTLGPEVTEIALEFPNGVRVLFPLTVR